MAILGLHGKHGRHRVRANLHSQWESRAWSNCKVQSVLEGWTGQNNTSRNRRVALTLGFARNMRIFGKESFTASNKFANCPKPKSGTSHSVCFLSQHLGLLTSSGAKHPEILAIRYQLNLRELARKPNQGGSTEGNPAPITPTTSREKAE